jgi:hypothetical protein
MKYKKTIWLSNLFWLLIDNDGNYLLHKHVETWGGTPKYTGEISFECENDSMFVTDLVSKKEYVNFPKFKITEINDLEWISHDRPDAKEIMQATLLIFEYHFRLKEFTETSGAPMDFLCRYIRIDERGWVY